MKRFYLQRNQDASGVSGLGKIAEGCEFDTKWCALIWLTGKATMSFYPDIESIQNIHGHGSMTQVMWVDDESSNVVIQREQGESNRSEITIGNVDAAYEPERRAVHHRRSKTV